MKKKELLSRIESFGDDSTIVFIEDMEELLPGGMGGTAITNVIEINNGEEKVIAFME